MGDPSFVHNVVDALWYYVDKIYEDIDWKSFHSESYRRSLCWGCEKVLGKNFPKVREIWKCSTTTEPRKELVSFFKYMPYHYLVLVILSLRLILRKATLATSKKTTEQQLMTADEISLMTHVQLLTRHKKHLSMSKYTL